MPVLKKMVELAAESGADSYAAEAEKVCSVSLRCMHACGVARPLEPRGGGVHARAGEPRGSRFPRPEGGCPGADASSVLEVRARPLLLRRRGGRVQPGGLPGAAPADV